MGTQFNQQCIGVGNAAETQFDVNGTIIVPPNLQLSITDYVLDYQGAGIIRVRADSLSGAIIHQRRIAADGEIISDMKTPLFLKNFSLTAAKTFVVTYQGAFACAAFFAGQFDTVQQ